MSSQLFDIKVSGCAPYEFPTDVYFGLLWIDEEKALDIPKAIPYRCEWGEILSTKISLIDEHPVPRKLSILWLSLVEEKYYLHETDLPSQRIIELWSGDVNYTHLVVGMAPLGRVAVWAAGTQKSTLLLWEKAQTVPAEKVTDFIPSRWTLPQYCAQLLKSCPEAVGGQIPEKSLYPGYMRQYCYRYVVEPEKWDDKEEKWLPLDPEEPKVEVTALCEALWDGTFDKLNDGPLYNYHMAGKPKKLALSWQQGKAQYTAYWWLDEDAIREAFERFYGAHPETKVDLIIRFAPDGRKFQLAMFRYGLKEPVAIKDDAYQVMVFKNGFEHHRSPNYSQPRGAWLW
ncbi:MAG: DUF2931 family protein [Bacteroidales bacterium]|nr:DUF2931 family protein [Bacteroidales bacterium]